MKQNFIFSLRTQRRWRHPYRSRRQPELRRAGPRIRRPLTAPPPAMLHVGGCEATPKSDVALLTDRLHVLLAHRLLRLRPPTGSRPCFSACSLSPFTQQLFSLEDRLIRLVASLDQLQFFLILGRVRFRVLLHPLDFRRVQTARSLDLDVRFFARVLVFRGHSECRSRRCRTLLRSGGCRARLDGCLPG